MEVMVESPGSQASVTVYKALNNHVGIERERERGIYEAAGLRWWLLACGVGGVSGIREGFIFFSEKYVVGRS